MSGRKNSLLYGSCIRKCGRDTCKEDGICPACWEKENPPPPIPAPEGEVPPRLSIRYRCNCPYERFIQFNFDGEKITCSGADGRVGKGTAIEDLYCLADNLGVASRELITAFLSAEKQRGLRAVEEARIDAERWRALLKCERIRILGSAGIGTQAQHLGMEIWDSYPGEHPDASEVLTMFADTIRARAAKEPS